MAIYAISDLHLAIGIDKPMDIFGNRWVNYMERLKAEWENTVSDDDHIIIPGDISWATYLEQAIPDFRFLEALPGHKYISKGNHDYWWTTINKLEKFKESQGLKTISFIHNNSFNVGRYVVCASRGWTLPGGDDFGPEDRKIYERELIRLKLSLESIKACENNIILTALHYPPFTPKGEPSEFVDIMSRFGVSLCIYGHLHGETFKNAVAGTVSGIRFQLVSADHLAFKPLLLANV